MKARDLADFGYKITVEFQRPQQLPISHTYVHLVVSPDPKHPKRHELHEYGLTFEIDDFQEDHSRFALGDFQYKMRKAVEALVDGLWKAERP